MDNKLADLKNLLAESRTDLAAYPRATEVSDEVLVYDASRLQFSSRSEERALQTELADALETGPGVVVVRQLVANVALMDNMTLAN